MRRALARTASDARRRYDFAADVLAEAPGTFIGIAAQSVDGFDIRLRSADPRRRAAEYERRIRVAHQTIIAAAGRARDAAFDRVREADERRRRAFAAAIAFKRSAALVAGARLSALGPSATLGRGYAIVFDARGTVLVDSARTAIGAPLDIALKRGRVHAAVTQTEAPRDQDRIEEED
jgi:exodeoxyribonuclease VII large subunit